MIEAYSFGRIRIRGRDYTSDLLIRDRQVLPNWWRRRGHGCCLEDILVALEHEPAVFVLGTGSSGMLKPDQDLKSQLAVRGVELSVMPTTRAVERFNRLLSQGGAVAAGFHLTC